MAETQLIQLSRVKQQLAVAKSIDEVKDIRNKAEALRAYAETAGLGLEMQNDCAEIKLRAERRAGELLVEQGFGEWGGDRKSSNNVQLEDLNISKIQSHRWQLEASVPDSNFEKYVAETKVKRAELTSHGLLRLALRTKANSPKIPFPEGEYHTIIVDPPWPMQKILREERPNQLEMDYPTMSITEITALPVGDLAYEDGCHLYLWTTHRFLPTAFEVFAEWGAKYECLLTWVKNVGFTPYSWMYSTEHCLFGRIGNLPLLKLGERLDFFAPVREHSRKPDEFYNLVRKVSPEPRIDVFSRQKHGGFAQYGDETAKFTAEEKVVAD